MATHRYRPPEPGIASDDVDRMADSGLPGWALVLRRTVIVAAVAAVVIIATSYQSDWRSSYELARSLTFGGGVVTDLGALLGMGSTSSGMQQTVVYPVPASWDMQGDVQRSDRRNRFIYRVTVPILLAGLMLLSLGVSGMLLL